MPASIYDLVVKPILGVVFVAASLAACSSGDRNVAISPGAGEALGSTTTAPASTSAPEPVRPATTATTLTASAAALPASTVVSTPSDPVVVVADDLGPVLDRVVLAEFGGGDGAMDLGLEECAGCDPVHPAAPILAGPDVGDLLVADVVNDRWQVVRDGIWESVPMAIGERVVGNPIRGTDGYLYAVIDVDGERRIDALSSFDLSWAASFPLPADEPGALHQLSDEIRFGNTVVTTVQRRPELPTWRLDARSNRLTLGIVDIERVFELPASWEMSPTEVAHLDDGTVVAHATVPNGDAPSASLLVRFWLDGSYATGTIGAPAAAVDGVGRLAEAGWVQLDDAISLYAFPEYGGPDPLAGWVAAPIVTPDPESVPRLLPADVAGAPSEWLRNEGRSQDPATARRYVQIWAQAGSDGVVTGLVDIRTGFASEPFNPSSTAVDVAGWPIARSLLMGSSDQTAIVMMQADRSVLVRTTGLGEAATVRLASRLAVDGDGEGWVPPFDDGSWMPIVEGWEADHPGRWMTGTTADGRRFELIVNRFGPSSVLTPSAVDRPAILTRIGDRPALLVDRGDVVGLAYSPSPDTMVVLGAESTADQLVAVANAIVEVDGSAWGALTSPDPSTDDGCTSFFC